MKHTSLTIPVCMLLCTWSIAAATEADMAEFRRLTQEDAAMNAEAAAKLHQQVLKMMMEKHSQADEDEIAERLDSQISRLFERMDGENQQHSDSGNAAAPNRITEDRSDLQPLIDRMAALHCREESSKLYQKRLLLLLPMIRNGANVNITTPETKGNTALHYSVAIGSLSITRWLLQHGADPNAATDKGARVIQCIGNDNAAAIRRLLLDYGANTAAPPVPQDNALAGHLARIAALPSGGDKALYKKRLLMLLPMIQRGAHVDTTTAETKGNTALHYACGLGDDSLVLWLLQHGANPNAVTHKGATPLQCAGKESTRHLLRRFDAY